jgi:hypothetical protein
MQAACVQAGVAVSGDEGEVQVAGGGVVPGRAV